jgi:starch phosphorylase
MISPAFNMEHLYGCLPTEVEGIHELVELALDMRWSWNHAADKLWKKLNPELWEQTRNPWIILQTTSRDWLKTCLDDPSFKSDIEELLVDKAFSTSKAAWFQQNHQTSQLSCVAYFSMEFMLSEALPIYVGGLGNVAGDQLKSASDLGVPVVAVGLLYQQGYFRQEITGDGSQQAWFPYNDPGQLPLMPLRLPNGEWLRFQINIAGSAVWLRTWQVQIGRVKLLLLDSNDAANLPMHREITNELYGGGPEKRIQQEILLGIGGWKMLRAMGYKPEVCHMNEGHAAFVTLERARDFKQDNEIPFSAALAVTRAGNLFTTHTAVAAGFDNFSPALMEKFFGSYAVDQLNISFTDLMALGRRNHDDQAENFSMAYLAVRGSGAVNAVSRLHGKVSRNIFSCLFPRRPEIEVPVGSVTNGVHMPSWDSDWADKLWTQACGKERWRGDLDNIDKALLNTADEYLWQMKNADRNQLVQEIRKRWDKQLPVYKKSSNIAGEIFNVNTLTIGFARRFVGYKRPNLLLQDEQRLVRILTNREQPVQLVIAGKAPPFDEEGKRLIQQWVQFIRRHQLQRNVIFLSDYNMLISESMVQGVDVWLNTPRRPWEACGTSGMKVLVNGGINLSELDGWWAEAYSPEVGWALGDGQDHGNDPAIDIAEASELYELLEQQVIPEFYSRNQEGIPSRWIERMRQSMAKLTPQFSANRTVREYTENYYLPAAQNFLHRAADKGAAGLKISQVHLDLKARWNGIVFTTVKTETIKDGLIYHISIFLNGIAPHFIRLELFAEALNNGANEVITMQHDPEGDNLTTVNFSAKVVTSRPSTDYTARIVPNYEQINTPLEDTLICWHH